MDGIIPLAFLYFIPAIVAYNRGHNNRMAVSLLNLLAGWTIVGWVGALVWACTKDLEKGGK